MSRKLAQNGRQRGQRWRYIRKDAKPHFSNGRREEDVQNKARVSYPLISIQYWIINLLYLLIIWHSYRLFWLASGVISNWWLMAMKKSVICCWYSILVVLIFCRCDCSRLASARQLIHLGLSLHHVAHLNNRVYEYDCWAISSYKTAYLLWYAQMVHPSRWFFSIYVTAELVLIGVLLFPH